MKPRTCVDPGGFFLYGIHEPGYSVANLRNTEKIESLGCFSDDTPFKNTINFPPDDVRVKSADKVIEINNPFPFRGVMYINSRWADRNAKNPAKIRLPDREELSLSKWAKNRLTGETPISDLIGSLPTPVLLTLAVSSTDPDDLMCIARTVCRFQFDEKGYPIGMRFTKRVDGSVTADINDHDLFEAVANNPYLPDAYKKAMVLKPGVQGTSEIVGEWLSEDKSSHVYEYLRTNSYIPWGHYAANMADDSVRYSIGDLTKSDVTGLRHLYYQRTYIRLAEQLGIGGFLKRQTLTETELEKLRLMIVETLKDESKKSLLTFDGSLWGWNFGFDFAPSGYRLHASHQQIHQQYALVPAVVKSDTSQKQNPPQKQIEAFGCGDLVREFIDEYRDRHGVSFFKTYTKAINTNQRTDKKAGPSSLIVWEDSNVLLFVPKAQVSQWELQLMVKRPEGNILETDSETRSSLNKGIRLAQKSLAGLGARMVTSIEYSKRFSVKSADQHLLYSFLPKLPQSPGAFSEAQSRWINGHYPEDFAEACRLSLQ